MITMLGRAGAGAGASADAGPPRTQTERATRVGLMVSGSPLRDGALALRLGDVVGERAGHRGRLEELAVVDQARVARPPELGEEAVAQVAGDGLVGRVRRDVAHLVRV